MESTSKILPSPSTGIEPLSPNIRSYVIWKRKVQTLLSSDIKYAEVNRYVFNRAYDFTDRFKTPDDEDPESREGKAAAKQRGTERTNFRLASVGWINAVTMLLSPVITEWIPTEFQQTRANQRMQEPSGTLSRRS